MKRKVPQFSLCALGSLQTLETGLNQMTLCVAVAAAKLLLRTSCFYWVCLEAHCVT